MPIQPQATLSPQPTVFVADIYSKGIDTPEVTWSFIEEFVRRIKEGPDLNSITVLRAFCDAGLLGAISTVLIRSCDDFKDPDLSVSLLKLLSDTYVSLRFTYPGRILPQTVKRDLNIKDILRTLLLRPHLWERDESDRRAMIRALCFSYIRLDQYFSIRYPSELIIMLANLWVALDVETRPHDYQELEASTGALEMAMTTRQDVPMESLPYIKMFKQYKGILNRPILGVKTHVRCVSVFVAWMAMGEKSSLLDFAMQRSLISITVQHMIKLDNTIASPFNPAIRVGFSWLCTIAFDKDPHALVRNYPELQKSIEVGMLGWVIKYIGSLPPLGDFTQEDCRSAIAWIIGLAVNCRTIRWSIIQDVKRSVDEVPLKATNNAAHRKDAAEIRDSVHNIIPEILQVHRGEMKGSPQQCFSLGCFKKESVDEKALSICSRCLNVQYCSDECQKRDWKQHKQICNNAKMR